MRNKKFSALAVTALLSSAILFTGCGKKENDNSEELKVFRSQIDSFCATIVNVDSSINAIDTSADGYDKTLLTELDKLDNEFKAFSAIDFPQDYDYLEPLADEAADYMTTAVTSYHDVFENDYSKETASSKYTYATENYSRAYKRIQVIVTFLNGEISEDVTISKE